MSNILTDTINSANNLNNILANKNNPPFRIFIAKFENYYEPIIVDSITWEMERKGSPSKLTFTVVKDKELDFCEGNSVRLFLGDKLIWYGRIFQKKRDKEQHIKVTAYDMLRYFKSKDTIVYENKTASELIKMIANDLEKNCGTIEDTKYKIPSRIEDNKTYLDMIYNALDETLKNKKEMYVLYDDVGQITLKSINNMKLDLLLDNETAENFDYNSSIDSQTYNKIKLTRENEETGKRDVYIVQDSSHIGSWGTLQYYESVGEAVNAKEKAETLLKLFNQKTKTLTIKDALGDIRVRAGCLIPIHIDLGDLTLKNYMMIDNVKHTIENGRHTMDMQLVGGEFVSGLVATGSGADAEKRSNKKQDNDSSGVGEKVLNGTKVQAQFTAYHPGDGGIEGGSSDMYGRKLKPGEIKMAIPKQLWQELGFTKATIKDVQCQIGDTGTDRDGMIYTIVDTGSALVKKNGRYICDIVAPNRKWMNNWGRRNGTLIISNGTGFTTNKGSSSGLTDKQNKLLTEINKHLGKPYRWGATGPKTFDCSGLMQYVYKHALNINIPRVSKAQAQGGRDIARKDMQVGDVIAFSSNGKQGGVHHVGMYIGDNKFIHAPQTGDVVKSTPLSNSYYNKQFFKARRFI